MTVGQSALSLPQQQLAIAVEMVYLRTLLSLCVTPIIILTGSAEMCQSGNESVDFNVIDSSLDTGGEYQCVSCNSIGTEILNFRVEILGI